METNQEIAEELNRKGFIRLDNGFLEEAIKTFSTKELVEELKLREGVWDIFVEPDQGYSLSIGSEETGTDYEQEDSGPAIILVVID